MAHNPDYNNQVEPQGPHEFSDAYLAAEARLNTLDTHFNLSREVPLELFSAVHEAAEALADKEVDAFLTAYDELMTHGRLPARLNRKIFPAGCDKQNAAKTLAVKRALARVLSARSLAVDSDADVPQTTSVVSEAVESAIA